MSPPAAPTPLWAHIACCVDESEASAAALREARRLRDQAPGRLTLVHVAFGPPHDATPPCPEWLAAVAAEGAGEPVMLTNLGVPAAAVCEWAAGARVDLIVASAHRGIRERILLGSFAGHLARHAPSSVLLTRP
jgi:nucleotide-binding universal stress UspA family protein